MALHPITIPVGPLTFDAVSAGPADGPPVLLLHGFPESSWSWRTVQPVLAAAGYATLAPDLRGYSPDARPTEPEAYRMDVLVQDVLDLADAMGWEGFHLVGHDWGGALAWQTAGRHPERVLTLAVVSTPHPQALADAKAAGAGADGDDQAARSSYMATFREPGSEALFLADDHAAFRLGMAAAGMADEDIEHYVARFPDEAAMQGALNWYRGADPADAAGCGPITMETLYVWSTEDIALGRRAAEGTAAHIVGPYRFVELEGVSHWIPEEAPEELAELLLDHLAPGFERT